MKTQTRSKKTKTSRKLKRRRIERSNFSESLRNWRRRRPKFLMNERPIPFPIHKLSPSTYIPRFKNVGPFLVVCKADAFLNIKRGKSYLTLILI